MPRITLDQLSTLLAIVRLGGVKKAAEALRLTQPAVTSRIKSLQSACSDKLFERMNGEIRLTKAGEIVFSHAESFEHLSDQLEKSIMVSGAENGRLRIGVSETIAQFWLPDFIGQLHRRFSELKIEITVSISRKLRKNLLDGSLDLVVLLGPVGGDSVESLELPPLELAWYASPQIAPALVFPKAFSDYPIYTYPRNTHPYQEIEKLLIDNVGRNFALVPCSSVSTCFRLVAGGTGIAALPRGLGAMYLRENEICEVYPEWTPKPLRFMVAYLRNDKSQLTREAAKLAQSIAESHHIQS